MSPWSRRKPSEIAYRTSDIVMSVPSCHFPNVKVKVTFDRDLTPAPTCAHPFEVVSKVYEVDGTSMVPVGPAVATSKADATRTNWRVWGSRNSPEPGTTA